MNKDPINPEPIKRYKRLSDNIFIEEPIKEVPLILYLDKIKKRRLELQEAMNTIEPTIDELLEFAKQTHPFYNVDKNRVQIQIDELNRLITKLENTK